MFNDIAAQRAALARLPEKRFIKTDRNVKGPYTSGDYVRWKLNEIFGPDNWCHTIVHGPELIRLNDAQAYIQAVVRLDVQFANGNQVTHEDVGVWPLAATNAKEGGTLDDTAPERYETVLKAVITDGLKACAESLGVCFRPLGDKNLETFLIGSEVGAAGAATNGKPSSSSAVGATRVSPAEPPKPVASVTNAAAPAANSAAPANTVPAPSQTVVNSTVVVSTTDPGTTVAEGRKKQASLKCSIKEFDRLAADMANKYPQYRLADGKPDKAHMLYTLAACGFPVITAANLEPAFEAAARHAAGLPTAPATNASDGVPF